MSSCSGECLKNAPFSNASDNGSDNATDAATSVASGAANLSGPEQKVVSTMAPIDVPLRSREPSSYQVVRETWLTQKPKAEAAFVTAGITLLLALGAIAYLTNFLRAGETLAASYDSVYKQHQFWQAWTTLFAHGDAAHLAGNSFLFFILGYFLYGYFGARMFPAAAFLWGGIANLIVLPTYDPQTHLIGASGIVYWMGGAWLSLYFFLSRQKNTTQRWLRSLGVAVMIFMPAETFEPKVSYRTHFVGFALGLLAGTLHFLWHRRKYQAAEIRETIVEEVDAEDELPGPDGFPVALSGFSSAVKQDFYGEPPAVAVPQAAQPIPLRRRSEDD